MQPNPVAVQVTYSYPDLGPAPVLAHAAPGNYANASAATLHQVLDHQGAVSYLTNHGWPMGLQQALLKNLERIPMRFFICDDSGSMSCSDGHRLVGEGGRRQIVPASRWAELGDFIRFHAGLAESAKAPSQFRMLNGSLPVMVGTGSDDGANVRVLNALLESSPGGGTPLCAHISAVINEIRAMEQVLRMNRQKVAVIIATDGESSDGDIAAAMQPLKDLPCWVVIRLCTDEDKVVNYWNNIDKVLELDLDILDDISGEAKEVCEGNTWLTYGEPLHRMREFGVTIKEMDLLDEGKLSAEQILVVIRTILGGEVSEYPSPYTDWNKFCKALTAHLGKEPHVWDPISQKPAPWIRVDRLGPFFGKKSGCTIS